MLNQRPGSQVPYYELTVTDRAGNRTIKNNDNVAPTINVTGNPTQWQNTDEVLTISASDNLSGIDSVTVNGEDITGEVSYTVSANGTYEFIATDKAGNVTTQTVVVNKIDKTAPTVSANRQWMNLIVNATDSGSGIKSVVVNGQDITSTLSTGRYTYRITNMWGSITVVVTDNVGNVTTYNA